MRIKGFWAVLTPLLALALLPAPFTAHARTFTARVVRVLDGDTVVTDSDIHVRLLDINTPEMAHDGNPEQPYAQKARDALSALVFGREIKFVTGPHEFDRFGRTLAHMFLKTGGWVNGTLVRDGDAVVYTFADNAMYPQELLAYEAQARKAKRGLWALPRWGVREAEDCCADGDIGQFELVEGPVVSAAYVKHGHGGRTYLNFGRDWRSDFSVFVDKRDEKYFRAAGIKNIAAYYKGKTVLVHGFLQPVNGVLVRVTHPAQLEIVGS